jgi:alpha-L-rhamnosidase
MKKYVQILLLIAYSQSLMAQLPPIFGSEYENKSRFSEIVKTYLTPLRIIWQSDNTGEFIQNPVKLLDKADGQLAVNEKDLCVLKSSRDHKPGILLDYGKEIYGGIKISMGIRPEKTPVKLRVRFGESVGEAMSDIGGERNATNDHSMRDLIIEVPWLGSVEVGETGFRFVRIDVVDDNEMVPLKSVIAAFSYRDIPYLGSFKSNDERLNQIWMTGAYTVHLNMQDYLWDGIKRDRLVWVGDMHPEVMTINTVFGKHDVVEKSLDLARDQYPLPDWMNGISSYSMWWVLIHREWYKYHGDLRYLREQKTYMFGLLDQLLGFIDDKNKEKLNGHRFLDWPSSNNPKAVHAGLHAMMVMTFEAGGELASILEEPNKASAYKNAAAKMRKYVPDPNNSKQAASLMALAGLGKARKINKEILAVDGAERMSTFYGYYILEARAKAGDYQGALDVIREYWGGMLDMGATTFWEDFNIKHMEGSARIDELAKPGLHDIHGDFGEYCYIGYRHSLCHGWASGPTAWLSQYVLGINIVEPGSRKIAIIPHLGDLDWVEGAFPTPHGIIKVRHEKRPDGSVDSKIDAPEGITIIRR